VVLLKYRGGGAGGFKGVWASRKEKNDGNIVSNLRNWEFY
jgi:hypothetical protein